MSSFKSTASSGLTRIGIFILVISILFLSSFSGQVSLAEGGVSSSEKIVGSIVYVDGKAYLTSGSNFMINYTVKNNGDKDIVEIEVEEKLFDQNDDGSDGATIVPHDSAIASGSEKTFQGRSFTAKKGAIGYRVEYTLRYRLADSEDFIFLKEGSIDIDALSTGVSVTYRASTGGPVTVDDEVNYTFEIKSSANIRLENIHVQDSVLGDIGTISSLEPGGTASVTRAFAMKKTTKSYPIISFDDPTGVEIMISREFENALVEVSVEEVEQVDKPLEITGRTNRNRIVEAEEVEFSITLHNKGNINLKNVKLHDWADKELAAYEVLEPGQKKSYIFSEKVEPGVIYNIKASAVEDGTNRDIEDSYKVEFTGIDARLEITNKLLDDEIAVGDLVTIEYVLRNVGSTSMIGILIEEPEMGSVAKFDELKPGAEESFVFETIIGEDTVSNPIVYAKDKDSGYEFEFRGSPLDIIINTIENLADLSISLSSEPESLSEPGEVDIICTIVNEGEIPINNITVILEEMDLNIGSILSLEPGAEEVLKLPGVDIEEETSFVAIAEGETEAGDRVEFVSEPYEVLIVDEEEDPKSALLKKVMWLIIILFIATLGGVAYLSYDIIKGKKGKKNKKAKNKNTEVQ